MGWKLFRLHQMKNLGKIALAAGMLALVGTAAQAQFGGGKGTFVPRNDPPAIPGDIYTTVSNNYLTVGIGFGNNVSGAFGIETTGGNATDPFNVIMEAWNHDSLVPNQTEPPYAPYKGGWLYVRVDGGTAAGGRDYYFGDVTNGAWVIAPSVIGNHIEARWRTVQALAGAGGVDPQIEIDVKASFVHNMVRFEFAIKNKNLSAPHSVGLAFIQDISANATSFLLDGPLRLPNQPYLRNETILPGALVPQKWETYSTVRPGGVGQAAQVHSIRGILKPANNGQKEPTAPTHFIYGRIGDFPNIAGASLATGTKVRDLSIPWEWDKYIDPSLRFDIQTGVSTTDAGVGLFWDPEVIQGGVTSTKVTFLGQAESEIDPAYPLSLAVSAPPSLSFVTDRTNPNAPVATVAPNPFTVTAYVQNLTDVQGPNPVNSGLGPVNVFLNLPPGLMLATGETANKQIADMTPGSENSVSWQVMLDPNKPRNGTLIMSVSATPRLGNGKNVQKTIEIPAPTTVVLKSNSVTGGLFEMKSFPLSFGGRTPSEALGLPIPTPTNGVTQQVDVLAWEPTTGHYVSQNTWIPGYAYWIRYNPVDSTITTKAFTIDAAKNPPLDATIQPNAQTYQVVYPRGWNQIGNPYVYAYRFSETQVFDNDTLQLLDVTTAADSAHGWLQSAIYHYDSTDPDTKLWHYDLLDSFGFQMQTGEGYWIKVNKNNLVFVYPGLDTPGGSITKAALLGAGLGTPKLGRGTDNNWRLRINAQGASSMDGLTYIGVAPKATNQADSYKYSKPPAVNNSVSLDIVHNDWSADSNGRYAQDLRAPGPTVKTWNLTLTSPRPNEDVTLSWPDIAASVPKTYKLTLVDTDTKERRDLRGTSSYVVNTGAAATRHMQIVAQPTGRRGTPTITSFDVVANGSTKAAGAPTSVNIHYTLSDSAETRVYIRDAQGHTVRTLTATTRDTGGSSVGEAVWDIKDQKGVTLPSGVYNVELVALGADGQRSRQVKPVIMSR